jgi:hypothetical protein
MLARRIGFSGAALRLFVENRKEAGIDLVVLEKAVSRMGAEKMEED